MNMAGWGAERLWWAAAAVFALAFAATLVPRLLDERMLAGVNVWAKPLKFHASLALHFATLALAASALSGEWRQGALLRTVALASIACAGFEIAYIVFQAARQQASHFNVGTPLTLALYSAMAAGAVVITAAAGVVALAAWLDSQARLGPATRAGIVLGFVGGTVLTLVVAFRLGGGGGPFVGVEPPGGARMPITGWSLTVGDRRVPHFFATHMMQAVPLAGRLLDLALPRAAALAGVVAAGAAWTALTLALFAQANAGLPLIRAS